MLVRKTLPITLSALGAATVTFVGLKGRLLSTGITIDATTPMADGGSPITLVYTHVPTGAVIFTTGPTAVAYVALPRYGTVSDADADLLYSAGNNVCEPMPFADDNLSVAITGGIAAGLGTVFVLLDQAESRQ